MAAGSQVTSQNSPFSSSSHTMDSLPQYGFGSEHSFENLLQDNPFLYRVYTPKARSPFFDPTEPFFVSHSFDDGSPTVDDISPHCTYENVAKHMDWTTRSTSPFVSTSFSFAWAIWEAVRRYRSGVKHDIEIAVIDARAVSGRAVTALELLRKGTPQGRHADYWKWYRFAVEAQDVLVHGSIPGTAVLASIPLFALLNKLPSYLLQPDVLDASVKESPLQSLGWDFTERKPSYRQLCLDMSAKFMKMPDELRVRDTTAGSVRLAVTFLRPWFHKTIQDDFELAKTTLCELAFVIAQWPGQGWVREHEEIWGVTSLMVQTLAEELREKQKVDASEEVRSLQTMVDNLENMVRMYQSELDTLVDPSAFEPTPPPPKGVQFSFAEPKAVFSRPIQLASEVPESKAPEPKAIDFAYDSSESKQAKSAPSPSPRPHSMIETISCLCTGLFVGAFITLAIMNGQRRTVIMHFT
ncbi:hypothetical protein FIBSPDRAFT_740788 [Athelia psychrophila]|uniref:DUF7587 domain-containing protein n=1 Tax=Athelia psychrophila TaxID=1759441 RepID=A0A166JW69_9AGAM|nr:hypothetical protein FIBSPDRAFT_740788 [Fibularhizoctonia sp. CBS 109695]